MNLPHNPYTDLLDQHNPKPLLRKLDKMNALITKAVVNYQEKMDPIKIKKIAIPDFIELTRKNRTVGIFMLDELMFTLKAGGMPEMATTIRNIFSLMGYQWDAFAKIMIEKVRHIYLEMANETETCKKRARVHKKNSIVLGDILTKITSQDTREYEFGVLKADRIDYLDERAKKSIRNFNVRRSDSMTGGPKKSKPKFTGGQGKAEVKIIGSGQPTLSPYQHYTSQMEREGVRKQDFEAYMYAENKDMALDRDATREKAVQSKVAKLLSIIDDEEFFDKYDPSNEDPLVIVALNRQINDEMITSIRASKSELDKFLQKGFKTDEPPSLDLMTQLTDIKRSMDQVRFDGIQNFSPPTLSINQRDLDQILETINRGIYSSIEKHLKNIVLTGINKLAAIKASNQRESGCMSDLTSEAMENLEQALTQKIGDEIRESVLVEVTQLQKTANDMIVRYEAMKDLRDESELRCEGVSKDLREREWFFVQERDKLLLRIREETINKRADDKKIA